MASYAQMALWDNVCVKRRASSHVRLNASFGGFDLKMFELKRTTLANGRRLPIVFDSAFPSPRVF
jgi:hypothetical protein